MISFLESKEWNETSGELEEANEVTVNREMAGDAINMPPAIGKWRLPASKGWPPHDVSTLNLPKMEFWAGSPQPRKKKVGKLKIPGLFGDA